VPEIWLKRAENSSVPWSSLIAVVSQRCAIFIQTGLERHSARLLQVNMQVKGGQLGTHTPGSYPVRLLVSIDQA
jgi:hypothetical protein